MQEISYSDVNLSKESEDMRTALGWMNVWVGWYTFVVCVGNFTFKTCNSVLFPSLSFCKSFFIFSSMLSCNNKTICVNNLDLSPLTDSYFSNKLLTHQLLFEITYSIFLFQNTILGMTNSKTLSSGMWRLCTYTKFHGVISRKAIIALSISF
jgi:hypothetical protein